MSSRGYLARYHPKLGLVYEEQDGVVLFDKRNEVAPLNFGRGPMVISDIEPFKDAGSNKVFTSRREWKDHLKANGLQEKGFSDVKSEMEKPKKKKELPPAKDDLVKALRKVKGL